MDTHEPHPEQVGELHFEPSVRTHDPSTIIRWVTVLKVLTTKEQARLQAALSRLSVYEVRLWLAEIHAISLPQAVTRARNLARIA